MMSSHNFVDTWVLTLAHSLWQGLAAFLIISVLLKVIPAAKASVRYWIAVIGLASYFLINVYSFYYLLPQQNTGGGSTTEVSLIVNTLLKNVSNPVSSGNVINTYLLPYSSFIVTAWLFGAILFLMRFTGNWWYLKHLRETGSPVDAAWQERLAELSQKLQIRRTVEIIENVRIDAPFVAGLLSPVIFVPIGITTGLSPQQLEAILIHELVHIKRHDYAINLFQSVLESVYFFNPFIWKLSEIIRTEREHCCDDAVVNSGADKKAYVYALTSLEEARLFKNGLVLSASGNKNQLFTRIKRVMEGSTTNYSLREKLIPVVLLVIGFACASWYSINRGPATEESLFSPLASADTTIKKKDKHDKMKDKDKVKDKDSKKQTILIDAQDTVTITDDSENPFFAMPEFDIPIPPSPDFEFEMPPIPDVDIPPIYFNSDYKDEFLKKFKDKFGDFYAKNQAEIDRMMEELEAENFGKIDQAMIQADAQSRVNTELARQHEFQARVFEDQARQHEAQMKVFEEKMHKWEAENHEKMQKLEKQMQKFELEIQEFNARLQEELVRDGYLEKGEKIDTMRFTDDGPIEINGKKIKESDRKKYREFHEKYFPKMEKVRE